MNQRQKSFIKYVVIAILLVIVFSNLNKCRRSSAVWVQGLPQEQIFFADSGKELKIAETSEDGAARIKRKLEPGSYLLYYQEDESTRHYGTLWVRKNEKETKIIFRKHRLPRLFRTLTLNTPEDVELGSIFTNYSLYSDSGNEMIYNAEMNILIRGKSSDLDNEFIFKWTLNVEGIIVSKEELMIDQQISEKVVLWEDKYHYYEADYEVKNNFATLELKAKFKQ